MEKETNKNLTGEFNAGDARSDGGAAHLSDEQIIAYRYGNFRSPEAEQTAQNHLTECACCTNLLLELNDFAETAGASARNAENTDVQWARFEEKRLAESKAADRFVETQPKPDAKRRKNFFAFPSFRFAAAFGILAVVALAGVFLLLKNPKPNEAEIARQTQPKTRTEPTAPDRTFPDDSKNGAKNDAKDAPRENIKTNANENPDARVIKRGGSNPPASSALQSKTKSKPKIETVNRPSTARKTNETRASSDESASNTADFSLYPSEVLRGAPDDARTIRVKKTSGGQIRLKLNAPKTDKSSAFSIVVADSHTKTVLTLPVLPDKRGDFYVIIPAEKLPADVYSLEIYAAEKSARKLFARYDFRLAYE